MTRSGSGNETIQSLCTTRSATRTLRSWKERQTSLRADVACALVVGTPFQVFFWEIWTVAMGPSTRLVAS